MSLTWDAVLQRDDIVGGDLESQEGGSVYRGPIASIEKQGDSIVITAHWIAKMDRSKGEWQKWYITRLSFTMADCEPQDIGNGRIFFSMPFMGVATIFPKGGSKLDPSKVKGLELSSAS